MRHELKKIWRPVNILVCLILLAGMLWTLYAHMYKGAPFIRKGMIRAWDAVLDEPEPARFVQAQYEAIDGDLEELQMQYLMTDSEEERKAIKAKIHQIEKESGQYYTGSLPFDLLVLSRIQRRLEHIDALSGEWEIERTILQRTIKRKQLVGAQAAELNRRCQRYAALSVPAGTNLDPYEDFAEWNTRYAYVILLAVVWVVAQSIPVEEKTGMGDLIRAVARTPGSTALCKALAGCLSACLVVSVQFICGLGLAVYMAGNTEGLRTGIQAMYALGVCCWDMPVYGLLLLQYAAQCALAVFAAGLTLCLTTFIQDEWMSIPVAALLLLLPNLLYILCPGAKGLDIASIFGVMAPASSNSARTGVYAAAALAACIALSGCTIWRFVRRRS